MLRIASDFADFSGLPRSVYQQFKMGKTKQNKTLTPKSLDEFWEVKDIFPPPKSKIENISRQTKIKRLNILYNYLLLLLL